MASGLLPAREIYWASFEAIRSACFVRCGTEEAAAKNSSGGKVPISRFYVLTVGFYTLCWGVKVALSRFYSQFVSTSNLVQAAKGLLRTSAVFSQREQIPQYLFESSFVICFMLRSCIVLLKTWPVKAPAVLSWDCSKNLSGFFLVFIASFWRGQGFFFLFLSSATWSSNLRKWLAALGICPGSSVHSQWANRSTGRTPIQVCLQLYEVSDSNLTVFEPMCIVSTQTPTCANQI